MNAFDLLLIAGMLLCLAFVGGAWWVDGKRERRRNNELRAARQAWQDSAQGADGQSASRSRSKQIS